MRLLVYLVGAGVAIAAMARAQTLGAAIGTVWIGRPLDIVVTSDQGGDEADPSALCAVARVRFGETPLPASEVSVSLVRDRGSGATGLRVTTVSPVDEPYVHVQLSVGCKGSFTRSYTLLAQLFPPTVADSRSMVTPAASGERALTQPSSSTKSPAASGQALPRRAQAAVPTGSSTDPAKARKVTPPPPRHEGLSWWGRLAQRLQDTPAPAQAGAGSALKVEPLVFESDEAFLEFLQRRDLPEVGLNRSEDEEAQQQKQEELRQSLEAVRKELQALQQENVGLRSQLAERAENSAYYQGALVAMGLLAITLVGWQVVPKLRRNAESQRAWWKREPILRWGKKDGGQAPAAAHGTDVALTEPPALVPQRSGDETASLQVEEEHVDWSNAPPAPDGPTGTPREGLSRPDGPDGMDGASSPAAPLDLAALHELWERVAFFEDLGQIADAVAALRSFVLAHPCASEAPYWRWWALANEHGLDVGLAQTTYEQHYHRLLQGDARQGTLLDDLALLQRLQGCWPGDDARALLEAALASQPDERGQSVLSVRSLAAFDDLITLHGMLDLLPLLPMTEPTPAAQVAAADSTIEFDFSGWSPAPVAAPPGAPR